MNFGCCRAALRVVLSTSLTENTALEITLATNVAFIVCTAPLLTTILSLLIYKKEKATAATGGRFPAGAGGGGVGGL